MENVMENLDLSSVTVDSINFEYNGSNYQIMFEVKNSKEVEISIIKEDDELGRFPFKALFNLKNLAKEYKYFKVLDNINEFVSFLKESINVNQINIKVDSSRLILGALAELFQKKDYIYLSLIRKEVSKKSTLIQLCHELDVCNGDLNDIQNRIDSLEIIIRDFLGLGNPNFFDSFIFTNSEQIELLKKAIQIKLNKEVKTFKKIYQASKDGDVGLRFHAICDGYSNCIILIKTAKGFIFGGFFSLPCSSEYNGYLSDPNAFIFSLNLMKIFECSERNQSIYVANTYLTRFGAGHDIYIENNFLSNSQSRCNQKSYNYEGEINALAGENNFQPTEIEVYHVITV